jgi:hypothetical protein
MPSLGTRSKITIGLVAVVMLAAGGLLFYFRHSIFPKADTTVTMAPYCPTSIPAPIYDGQIDVLSEGLKADGTTDNSAALQAILDRYKEQDIGATLYFPAGEYRFDSAILIPRDPIRCNSASGKLARTPSGARQISFLGDGRGQTVLKTSTVAGPLFTWNDTYAPEGTTKLGTNGKASFRDLSLINTKSKGELLKWKSYNPELDKMQLSMDQVDIEYLGNTDNNDDVAALDFSGIFVSHIYDVVVKGGHPSNATVPGIGLKVNRGSMCSFDDIAFVSSDLAATGRAVTIDTAGIFDLARLSIDGGNQENKPVFFFKDAKQIIATSLSGTNITQAGAFVRTENVVTMTFENLVAPVINSASANLVELASVANPTAGRVGTRAIIFTGGELGDQASRGGSGKALVVDNEANFIVATQLMMTNAKANISLPAGKDIALDVLNQTGDAIDRAFFGNHKELAEAAGTTSDLFDENGELRVKLGVGNGLASFFNRFPTNPILTLKAAEGQSANILSVKDSNDVEKAAIGPNGELKIGESGTPIKKHLSQQVSIDPSAITSKSTIEQTVAIDGLKSTDTVVVTPSGTPEAGLVWQQVSADNTLKLRFTNLSANTIDPANRDWRVDIWQYD